jgi:hypothetical protein
MLVSVMSYFPVFHCMEPPYGQSLKNTVLHGNILRVCVRMCACVCIMRMSTVNLKTLYA